MADGGAADWREWAVTRILTREMRKNFYEAVGRPSTDADFVVRKRYPSTQYTHWYYFYDSAIDALVRPKCYGGLRGPDGYAHKQRALECARAYVNEP